MGREELSTPTLLGPQTHQYTVDFRTHCSNSETCLSTKYFEIQVIFPVLLSLVYYKQRKNTKNISNMSKSWGICNHSPVEQILLSVYLTRVRQIVGKGTKRQYCPKDISPYYSIKSAIVVMCGMRLLDTIPGFHKYIWLLPGDTKTLAPKTHCTHRMAGLPINHILWSAMCTTVPLLLMSQTRDQPHKISWVPCRASNWLVDCKLHKPGLVIVEVAQAWFSDSGRHFRFWEATFGLLPKSRKWLMEASEGHSEVCRIDQGSQGWERPPEHQEYHDSPQRTRWVTVLRSLGSPVLDRNRQPGNHLLWSESFQNLGDTHLCKCQK